MADVPGQPLKPSRRAFLKAMGAMAGAAALPAALPVKLPVIPEVALPPVLTGLDIASAAITPSKICSDLLVFVNGIMQMEGPDFVRTGNGEIRFTDAPPAGSLVDVGYATSHDFPRTRHMAGGTTINFEEPKGERNVEPYYLAHR